MEIKILGDGQVFRKAKEISSVRSTIAPIADTVLTCGVLKIQIQQN